MIEIITLGACLTINVSHNFAESDRVRFVNVVTKDVQPPKAHLVQPSAPYIDPPLGGWEYQKPIANDDIYYWDSNGLGPHSFIKNSEEGKTTFIDCPKDSYLTHPGMSIDFTTLIVDSHNNNEVLYVVDWELNHKSKVKVNYNGQRKLYPVVKKLLNKIK